MSFYCNRRKIPFNTNTSPQALTPVYRERVNLVEDLTKDDITTYREANPDFFLLFAIVVLELLSTPVQPAP